MTAPRLLAVGGAHMERCGRFSGAFAPEAAGPGLIRESVGGAAFNALRAAIMCGARDAPLPVSGGDGIGEAVGRQTARLGMDDLSVTFLDRASPGSVALYGADGGLIARLEDTALYDLAFPRQMRRRGFRDRCAAADAILVDAEIPEDGLRRLVETAGGKPVIGVAPPMEKAARFSDVLPHLAVLFTGSEGAERLAGASGDAADLATALARLGLRAGVVSDGHGRVVGFDASGMFELDLPAPAGLAIRCDALAGAAAAALAKGCGLRDAVRDGAARIAPGPA